MATIFKRRRRKPIPQGATLKTFRGKRVADFHATRHTYISGIVAGGASVKTAQELARHSTPTLTIGRYAHTRLLDLRGALDGLPGGDLPEGPEAEADALRATGTTDATGSKWQQNGQQSGGKTRLRVALSGEPEGESDQGDESTQTLTLSRKETSRQQVAATGLKYPLGKSNYRKKPRGKRHFSRPEGQNRVHFSKRGGAVTRTWPGWFRRGRGCPRTFGKASWRRFKRHRPIW